MFKSNKITITLSRVIYLLYMKALGIPKNTQLK